MMKSQSFIFSIIIAALSVNSNASACDLCAIYSAQNIRDSKADALTLGAVEQFTAFHTLKEDGERVANSAQQSMTSSVTQLYGRYDLSDEFGVQLNLPIISRHYRRPEAGEMKSGSESGIGDASLLGLYTPVQVTENDYFLRLTFRGGVKLPTGDASRIREETEEGHSDVVEGDTDSHTEDMVLEDSADHSDHAEHMHDALKHGGESHGDSVESGIHGHDLALGSGSFDYVVGVSSFVEKGMYFSIADLQYSIRTEGDFDYRYQNDLIWSLGAGRYLLTEHEKTLSLRANISGEYKGKDVFQGNKADDTGINSIFLGPEINFTAGEKLFGLIAFDLPVLLDNTALQLVPDYRIRLGITYRF